jgi:lactate permease
MLDRHQITTTPVGNSLGLSVIFAALPLVTLFVLLGVMRMKAWLAGVISLIVALVVAVAVYSMPVGQALLSGTEGAAFGFFPILWIVLNAIWVYNLTVHTGHFDVLRRSFTRVSPDMRVQAIIIAFCFGALMEALAGFGTPVAICVVMLMALGFRPIHAASLSLIANTAPVAFGALATPIVTLGSVASGAGSDPRLNVDTLGAMVGRQTPILSVVVPIVLLLVVDGRRGLRQTWPAGLVAGLFFGLAQYVASNYISVQLTDIIAALVSAAAVVLMLRFWQPAESPDLARSAADDDLVDDTTATVAAAPGAGTGRRGRLTGRTGDGAVTGGGTTLAAADGEPAGLGGEPEAGLGGRSGGAGRRRATGRPAAAGTGVAARTGADGAGSGGGPRRAGADGGLDIVDPPAEVAKAYAPYLIIVIIFSIANIGGVKHALAKSPWTKSFHWPKLDVVGANGKPLSSLVFAFGWLPAAGTLMVIAGILTAIVLRVPAGQALRTYGRTYYELRYAIVTIMAVLALAYVLNQSGQTNTLGVWLAGAGSAFAFLSAILGWLGTAVTGSDTSSNALFGALQVQTAGKAGLDPVLLAAANSSGGVMGKMISPQNLAIAASAVGMAGKEGEIFRKVLGWSLVLLLFMCILVSLQATPVLDWMVPG